MRPLLPALALILSVAACGGAASPTAPAAASNDPAPTATTGVIHGTIAGGTSGSLYSTNNAAAAGMTVTIEGTNISATVNGLGQFVLSNVPAGTPIVLRFSGAGASNATVSIGTVTAGQTVTITVVVSGAEATLEEKTQGNDREIEGRIESITGSTLKVAGRTVTVSAATEIRHGDTTMTLSQLEVGQRVHVKGTVSGTGTTATTLATLILVQNLNTAIPTQLDGAVSDLAGAASAFQFKIGSTQVKGTSATEFTGGAIPQFAGLANGVDVHVSGTQANGFVQATRIVLKDGGQPQPGATWTGAGNAGGVSGACPSLSFTIKGITVRSSAATAFNGGVTCATFKNGTAVTATGTVQADGSVLAASIVKS